MHTFLLDYIYVIHQFVQDISTSYISKANHNHVNFGKQIGEEKQYKSYKSFRIIKDLIPNKGNWMMSHMRGESSTYSSMLSMTSISVQLVNIILQPWTISWLHGWRIVIGFDLTVLLSDEQSIMDCSYALLLFLYYFKSLMIELTTNDIHKQRNASSFPPSYSIYVICICNLWTTPCGLLGGACTLHHQPPCQLCCNQ